MKNLAWPHHLLFTAVLLAATASQAARPLVTDDAGVLAHGDCELEAVASRDRADGLRVQGYSLQIGCGAGAHTQVALAVGRAKDADLRVRGTALSAKFALMPGDEAGWALSGSLQWTAVSDQRSRHSASALNLVHTRNLGESFLLHANLGHARDERADTATTTWGAALEHAGWGPVALMGELHGDDRSPPWWNLGARWVAVPNRLVLDVAYGRQITGGRPAAVSVGIKLAF